ncbi:hypothetical protein G6F40_017252 [Rhizopus arrhizus]|nr:hypothetical protein G6F40_017252 [Rhizopus arrhizus]
MGSATISDEVEIEIEALVTVQIDADGITLDGVELLPVTLHMHFNDIEPDWMSDPDNYDTHDRDFANVSKRSGRPVPARHQPAQLGCDASNSSRKT